jgi:formate-dependent nitrite reductase membrane component NrfD
MKKLLSILLVLAVAAFVSAQSSGVSSATSAICQVLSNIQWMLYMIAAGVGVVVITLQGIKWTGSAEDPGARKQAKQGIIHAVVGLLIVLMAVWIVGLVFTSGQCGGWAS